MDLSAFSDALQAAPCSVPRRSFEGLLLSEPAPPSALREAMGAAGFDAECPDHLYPYQVWAESLRAARDLLFPELPLEDGLFALGRRFADGFGRTVVGRVLRAHTDSLLGPERALVRLPSILAAGVKGLVVELQPLCASHWRLRCRTQPEEASFFAGTVHGLLEGLGLPGLTVCVAAREGASFELAIGWEPRATGDQTWTAGAGG